MTQGVPRGYGNSSNPFMENYKAFKYRMSPELLYMIVFPLDTAGGYNHDDVRVYRRTRDIEQTQYWAPVDYCDRTMAGFLADLLLKILDNPDAVTPIAGPLPEPEEDV